MVPSRIERLALGHDSHRKTPIQTNGETEAIVSVDFAYCFVLSILIRPVADMVISRTLTPEHNIRAKDSRKVNGCPA